MSCPVCFGGDDPVARESLNAGIGVLLGVTGVVLGCFARFFVGLARRARAAGEDTPPMDTMVLFTGSTNHRDPEAQRFQ
jgi:hypothetical protein